MCENVFECVCVCVEMCTCMCVCAYVYVYICECLYMFVCCASVCVMGGGRGIARGVPRSAINKKESIYIEACILIACFMREG